MNASPSARGYALSFGRRSWVRQLVVAACLLLAVGTLASCSDPVAEAEESSVTYFSATASGNWEEAVGASTGVAQYRALFYQYLDQIPGVPPGAKFEESDDAPVTAEFEELVEVEGALRASGTLTNGPEADRVDFVDDGGKISVSDFRVGTGDEVFPISMLWGIGTEQDTQGGITLRPLAGRQSRVAFGQIVNFQWVIAVQNSNSWPAQVVSVTLTPLVGQPVTWRPDAPTGVDQSANPAIAVQETVPPGEIGGIWVRQDATATQGGGTLTVTVEGAGGVTQQLSADLPTLTVPEGWQPVG